MTQATPRPPQPQAPAKPALTIALLTPILGRALGVLAVPTEWSLTPLRASLGAATGGLYLVRGTAYQECGASRTAASPPALRWTVVLKVVRPPSGTRHDAFARDPAHFAYWQREPLIYASGLLNDLPGGLTTPRCLGVQRRGPEEVWLWLEHLQEDGAAWERDRY